MPDDIPPSGQVPSRHQQSKMIVNIPRPQCCKAHKATWTKDHKQHTASYPAVKANSNKQGHDSKKTNVSIIHLKRQTATLLNNIFSEPSKGPMYHGPGRGDDDGDSSCCCFGGMLECGRGRSVGDAVLDGGLERLCVCVCMYLCMHRYIYIYIYMHARMYVSPGWVARFSVQECSAVLRISVVHPCTEASKLAWCAIKSINLVAFFSSYTQTFLRL